MTLRFLLLVVAVSVTSCSGSAERVSPSSGSSSSGGFVPPSKLQRLGLPLRAEAIVSIDPSRRFALVLDAASSSFRGEVIAPIGRPFDLTAIYWTTDAVTGEEIEAAHYVGKGLVALVAHQMISYQDNPDQWESVWDLSPGNSNALNLDGDPYSNWVELGYGSDLRVAEVVPVGAKVYGEREDDRLGFSLGVSLPSVDEPALTAMHGVREFKIKVGTPFEVKTIEVLSPSYGVEVLSEKVELVERADGTIEDQFIRVRVDTELWAIGPEVKRVAIRVKLVDE